MATGEQVMDMVMDEDSPRTVDDLDEKSEEVSSSLYLCLGRRPFTVL